METLPRARGALPHASLDVGGTERGPEQRTDDVRELLHTRDRCVRRASEDAPQRRCIGRGADAEAQATGATTTRLRERAPCVGFAVGTFVAVVVGEAVGQHNQEPPLRATVAL